MQDGDPESFTGRLFGAMNSMLLDMLAAIARKDYEDRARRTSEGIKKARDAGKFKGRAIDQDLHNRVAECLRVGMPIRKTAKVCGCANSTVQRIKGLIDKEQDQQAAA